MRNCRFDRGESGQSRPRGTKAVARVGRLRKIVPTVVGNNFAALRSANGSARGGHNARGNLFSPRAIGGGIEFQKGNFPRTRSPAIRKRHCRGGIASSFRAETGTTNLFVR